MSYWITIFKRLHLVHPLHIIQPCFGISDTTLAITPEKRFPARMVATSAQFIIVFYYQASSDISDPHYRVMYGAIQLSTERLSPRPAVMCLTRFL